jgi:predicted GNAT family acetyltransferase
MISPIAIRNELENTRFVAEVDGAQAVAEYLLSDGAITFTHTFVPDALRGRGIATQLIRVALADSRERGLQVTPRCPLFLAYMKEHAETHDLLTPVGRRLVAG